MTVEDALQRAPVLKDGRRVAFANDGTLWRATRQPDGRIEYLADGRPTTSLSPYITDGWQPWTPDPDDEGRRG